MSELKVYIVAGEASGDLLGAKLIEALRSVAGIPLSLRGIAGPKMKEAGVTSLFPIKDIALMGFAEVVPHLFRLKKRIRQTVKDIEAFSPHVLITIDSPGFNFRVVKRLRARAHVAPVFVHYVAPTVWAYKPERAKKAAALFDHMLCLLPFEPPHFIHAGLSATFVGHPVADDVEEVFTQRMEHFVDHDSVDLCLLPGSRSGEVSMLLPIFREVIERLKKRYRHIRLVILTHELVKDEVEELVQDWPETPLIIADDSKKRMAMYQCDVALCKSGTVALELAKHGLPMVVTYRVHPLSARLMKRLLRTPYVSLVNMLKEQEVIPELLQERCNPDALADELAALIDSGNARGRQRMLCYEALKMLKPPVGTSASLSAAGVILSLLKMR